MFSKRARIVTLKSSFHRWASWGAGARCDFGLILSRSEQIAALATQHRIPAIYGFREFAVAGGLMSYGGTLAESLRWIGVYTGQISQG